MNGNMKAVTEWCRIKTNRAVGGTKITHAGGQRLRFAVCVCVCGKEREGVDPVVRCLYVSATLNMHPVTSILRPQVDMDKQEYFVCLLCCISIIFHW